ncbi:hypothetical protein WJU23_14490 [Prosthecobacter sp. SYSU 5D2]|uniref:hypothetical protein n=1 Tax=Prosthecobacter sp. SYSU 5D2 TaxID=3134134 RepID=UPI0031FF2BD6
MTETEIANLALSFLGSRLQTADVATETTKEAVTCRKWLAAARDECLISHPWNFAMVRKRLAVAFQAIETIEDSAPPPPPEEGLLHVPGAILVEVTDHGLVTGDRVCIRDAGRADGRYFITRVDDDYFTLDGTVHSGTYAAGGRAARVPPFGWAWRFDLPADCLAVRTVNGGEGNEEDSVPYEIEGRVLLMDAEILELKYTAQITDTALWSQNFTNAFALLLASCIAQDLTGPAGRAMELRQQYERVVAPLAKSKDSKQGKGRVRDPDYNSRVLAARRGAGFLGGAD